MKQRILTLDANVLVAALKESPYYIAFNTALYVKVGLRVFACKLLHRVVNSVKAINTSSPAICWRTSNHVRESTGQLAVLPTTCVGN